MDGVNTIIDNSGNKTFINEKYGVNHTIKSGNKTQNEIMSDNLSKTLKDWVENRNMILYEGDLEDLKPSMRISYITNKLLVRIGGWIRAVNINEGYISMTGKGRSSWSVQIKDITGEYPTGIWIQNNTFELYKERQNKKLKKELVKLGLMKRTRQSKNTPELIEAYKKAFDFYYEKAEKTGRDYLYKFIKSELTNKLNDGSLTEFLKDITDSNYRFDAIPRGVLEEFVRDAKNGNKVDIIKEPLKPLQLNSQVETPNGDIKRIVKIMKPKNKKKDILYIVEDDDNKYTRDELKYINSIIKFKKYKQTDLGEHLLYVEYENGNLEWVDLIEYLKNPLYKQQIIKIIKKLNISL